MRAYDTIKKKRDGHKLAKPELDRLVSGYVSGTLPDEQMAAFLMAVFFRGMDEEETFWLTDLMRRSGDLVSLDGIKGFTVDKHSTGGVGDKTSLVLGPLLAALGLKVAKMSGRGLGHTGGTIDKLEAIDGFTCDLARDKFIEGVNTIGLAIIGQTGNLVPADKKIYAIRDITATIDSIPLIAASIMSKKLAVANQGLILDVKVGSGAFMKDLDGARALARLMVKIGHQDQRRVTAVLSNMDEPLGEMIGNALEVKEAVATLKNSGPSDFTALVKTLAIQALMLSKAGTLPSDQAATAIDEALQRGHAFDKFLEMVRFQGGNTRQIEHLDLLPTATEVIPLCAKEQGYIKAMDCEEIGLAAMMLGAGRETKESVIDPAVGFQLRKHVGDRVDKGDVLADIHVNPTRDHTWAIERLAGAIHLSPDPVQPQPLIHDIISS